MQAVLQHVAIKNQLSARMEEEEMKREKEEKGEE